MYYTLTDVNFFPISGDAASQNGVTSVNYASRDLSPAHRINNTRRASVLREMLEHASEEQKTQVRPAFLCLSVRLLSPQLDFSHHPSAFPVCVASFGRGVLLGILKISHI